LIEIPERRKKAVSILAMHLISHPTCQIQRELMIMAVFGEPVKFDGAMFSKPSLGGTGIDRDL
jgi:hypothetical protein